MLKCGWPPNTIYFEVLARERHKVKLIGISNKAIHIPTIFFKKSNI